MRLTTRILIKLILFASLLSIQCKNEKAVNSSPEINHSNKRIDTSLNEKIPVIPDSLPKTKGNATDFLKAARNKLTAELLKKIKTVEVITIDKENTRIASTGEDLGIKCDKWNLDKTSIEKIIKISKPISGEEWHHLYDVWPCYHVGEVNINGKEFSYSVNGGSYIFISSSDTTFLYGCTDKRYEKYFLSKVWNPEKEE